MNIFTGRLRKLKEQSGKTQIEIAKAIGITPQAFSYYMNGRQPPFEILIKIAKYFNVTTDYLLGVSDSRNLQNASVACELGLNDEVIEVLKAAVNEKKAASSDTKTTIDAINLIFSALMSCPDVLENFEDIMNYDFDRKFKYISSDGHEFDMSASEVFELTKAKARSSLGKMFDKIKFDHSYTGYHIGNTMADVFISVSDSIANLNNPLLSKIDTNTRIFKEIQSLYNVKSEDDNNGEY